MLAIYFVIWWIVLFAVLPWGTHPVATPDSETGWRGAPARPRMGIKIIATTLIAVVVWGMVIAAYEYDLLGVRITDSPKI